MKLATFTHQGKIKIGRVDGDKLTDLTALAPDMVALFGLANGMEQAANASGAQIAVADVTFHSPVLNPSKILAIGLNYKDHIEETGLDTPEFPMFFNKQVSAVNGPYDPIHMPKVSEKLDYEGEMGFIIGRRCRHVPRDRAHEVIAGFTVCNDVSVRDWQMRAQTFTLGKSFDSHSPFGPYLVTPDEVGDPHNLNLKTTVNGETRQDSNTKHLVFDCYDQIETLTAAFTLEPGDLIVTGTPSGVGIGFKPHKYLHVGDTVRVEIEKLGHIENEVIAEPASTAMI